ncbi:MAG: cation transporter [Cyclobacteriaceae bacterium]
MTYTYQISGMTCNGCREHVEEVLRGVAGVSGVTVDLAKKEASIEMTNHIETQKFQEVLAKDGGKYGIHDQGNMKESLHPMPEIKSSSMKPISLATYKPLILIVLFVAGVPALVQIGAPWSWMLWMRHFMAGFFLTFSFFKLINLKGFASSYAMYDLLAAKWKTWGFIYPFVELGLGIGYLVNYDPILINWITVVVLGFSSIGVIQSNLSKRKIKCACLGDVFDLPMSTVTIIEDLTMVAMAGWMIFSL